MTTSSLYIVLSCLLICQLFPVLETFHIRSTSSILTAHRNSPSSPLSSHIHHPSQSRITSCHYASIGGERWGEFLQHSSAKVLGPATLLHHHSQTKGQMTSNTFEATRSPQSNGNNNRDPWTTGDEQELKDPIEQRKQLEFHCNIGKAIDTLRSQLPMFFYLPTLDFSIFGDYILVSDNNQNKITMSKNVYITIIRSIQMAASFSKIYPSLNLQKIDYIKELQTIQCRVQIVLPDSIRIEGQSIWEGMFYFGLDDRGLINSHIFDRNMPIMRPDNIPAKATYPWLRVDSLWNPRTDQPLTGSVFGTSLADRLSAMLLFEASEESPVLPETSFSTRQ